MNNTTTQFRPASQESAEEADRLWERDRLLAAASLIVANNPRAQELLAAIAAHDLMPTENQDQSLRVVMANELSCLVTTAMTLANTVDTEAEEFSCSDGTSIF